MPFRLLAIAAAAFLGCTAVATGCGTSAEAGSAGQVTPGRSTAAGGPPASRISAPPSPSPSPPPAPTLPRGGRRILPTFRVVAHYGSVGGPALGVLGQGSPDEAADRVARFAHRFAGAGRPVLPAMELITTIASAKPEADGTYSRPVSPADVDRYLAAARRHRMLLILDLQPGRGDFAEQARRYERFLRQPDVSLALDPEWKMGPGELPGKKIGHSDAAGVNQVSRWLSGLVGRYRLPEKLFVVHEFAESMLPDRDAIVPRPGLATVFHVDGFGGQRIKIQKYADLHGNPPFYSGLKLFLRQDTAMMSPEQVMALRPAPDLVTYQ